MGKLEKAFKLALLLNGVVSAIILVLWAYQTIYVEGCDWATGHYPGILDVILHLCIWGVLFGIGFVPIFLVYLISVAFRWVINKGHEKPSKNLPFKEVRSID